MTGADCRVGRARATGAPASVGTLVAMRVEGMVAPARIPKPVWAMTTGLYVSSAGSQHDLSKKFERFRFTTLDHRERRE